jgi:hypothetical protein
VTMPPVLVEQSFDAEQLRAMDIAFERACRSLGLGDAIDPLTDLIAIKVIEAARSGETDPVRLYEAVMHWTSAA